MNVAHHSPHVADLEEAKPELSVILSCLNESCLPVALDLIYAQALPSGKFEVIAVVDPAAGDQRPCLAGWQATHSIRIIEASNQKFTAALNKALEAARGRIVMFTRDDLTMTSGNLSAHLAAHEGDEARIVYGKIHAPEREGPSLTNEWDRVVLSEDSGHSEADTSWPVATKAAISYSVKLEMLRACGAFDEDLAWRCHDDLCFRMIKMGAVVYEETAAISELADARTAEEAVRIARERGKEEIAILRKHPELRPQSVLAGFADSPSWKWLAIKAAARISISPEVLLRPMFSMINSLRFLPAMRRLRLRVLRTRVNVSFVRGAVKSAGWHAVRDQIGMRLPVFMYHHVGPPQPDSEPALFVSTARFEKHLRFLKRKGYRGISAGDWTSWVRNAKPLPAKPVLLTFDDAIADLYEHAFPVLERYGFNAVVFVPTNCVGKGNLWNHSLGYKWRPCLNAEQIRYWSVKGFEFGAHSRNHPDLTALNESELQDEVAGSRADLEKIVASPVISFAYPYGHYNSAAAQCVGQQFDLGFTIEEGLNNLRTDRSLMRRCTVFEWDTLLDLGLMLHLGWNPIRRLKIRQRVRGLKRRLGLDTQ